MTDTTVPLPAPVPPAPSGPSPLVADVLRLANRIHGLTVETGHPELTARVEAEAASWKDESVRIVVAGEIKRGKSSLINTLLGHPGLLTVDADVATSVHLAVHHADQLTIEVTRRAADENREERFAITADDLADYGSMLGDDEKRNGVTAVEIGLPHPMLERGLVVIDTPGVGGLTRGHRDIALASLRLADALVFAVSVEEPISLSELQFLAEASERIDTVVIVLTKVDASADWEDMLTENRAKMATFLASLQAAADQPDADEDAREAARRFGRVINAPVLPVSSRLADKAAAREAAGRPDAAITLRERSGFAAVEATLDRTLSNREQLRLGNILRLGSHVLARIETEQDHAARVAAGDHTTVEAELAARQALLDELVPSQARWRQRLAGNIQRIQADLNRVVGREMNQMERHYREHIDAAGKTVDPVMEALSSDLEHSINASWVNLSVTLTQRLESAVAKIADEFSLDDIGLEMDDAALPEYLRELSVDDRSDPNAGKVNLVEDGLPVAFSASIMSSLVGSLFFGAALPLLPGLILAAPVGYMRYKKRHQAQVRQDYLRIVRDVIGQVRQEFVAELTLKIIEAREKVEDSIDAALTARRAEIEAQRKELKGLLQETRAEQQRRRTEAEARLTKVRALRADADQLRERIS